MWNWKLKTVNRRPGKHQNNLKKKKKKRKKTRKVKVASHVDNSDAEKLM